MDARDLKDAGEGGSQELSAAAKSLLAMPASPIRVLGMNESLLLSLQSSCWLMYLLANST